MAAQPVAVSAPRSGYPIMSTTPKPRGQIERWLVPALIILFCLGAIWLTTTFKKMPPILKRGIQPSDFPQLLLSAIILMTLAMAWFDPVRVREQMQGATIGSILLFGVFALLNSIDLFLALAIFAAGLSGWWGERRIWVLALVGLVMPVVIFFLFDLIFEIRFPRGLLTNIWYG